MTSIFLILWALSPISPAEAPRERVEAISLQADGASGVVETSGEFIDGQGHRYHFGGGECAAHRLSDRTLEQLFGAMRGKSFVRIEAKKAGRSGKTECLAAVTFFAQ